MSPSVKNQSCKTENTSKELVIPIPHCCSIKIYQLFNGDGGGDLSPEAGELDRRHQLLWVSVYVSVEHEATEGGAEVEWQRLVHHTQKDELHVQLLGDLVYGQILPIQTHSRKELQLIP